MYDRPGISHDDTLRGHCRALAARPKTDTVMTIGDSRGGSFLAACGWSFLISLLSKKSHEKEALI